MTATTRDWVNQVSENDDAGVLSRTYEITCESAHPELTHLDVQRQTYVINCRSDREAVPCAVYAFRHEFNLSGEYAVLVKVRTW